MSSNIGISLKLSGGLDRLLLPLNVLSSKLLYEIRHFNGLLSGSMQILMPLWMLSNKNFFKNLSYLSRIGNAWQNCWISIKEKETLLGSACNCSKMLLVNYHIPLILIIKGIVLLKLFYLWLRFHYHNKILLHCRTLWNMQCRLRQWLDILRIINWVLPFLTLLLWDFRIKLRLLLRDWRIFLLLDPCDLRYGKHTAKLKGIMSLNSHGLGVKDHWVLLWVPHHHIISELHKFPTNRKKTIKMQLNYSVN